MKIAKHSGLDSINRLADALLPAEAILTDPEITKLANGDTGRLFFVHKLLKLHGKEVLEIAAIMEHEDPATYNPTVPELIKKMLKVFSDPEIKSLFFSQAQKNEGEHSGSATENTEVPEE